MKINKIYPFVSGDSVQHKSSESGGVSTVNSFLEGLSEMLSNEKWGEGEFLVPKEFKETQLNTVAKIDANASPMQVITMMLNPLKN